MKTFKFILSTLTLFFSFLFITSPASAVETKKVCVDMKDKQGKTKQQCKDMKVHKKLEGTKVPDGQKKK